MLKTVQPHHICNIGSSKCRHSFHALTANSQYKEYTGNQTSIVFWDVPVTIKIDNYWKSAKTRHLHYFHIRKNSIISLPDDHLYPNGRILARSFHRFLLLWVYSWLPKYWVNHMLIKKWKCSSNLLSIIISIMISYFVFWFTCTQTVLSI